MVFRSIVVASILASASVAAAQTPVEANVSPDTLRQVQTFEANLRAAIERAGGQMFARARDVVSDVELRLEANPKATGIVLPDGEGMLFMVEVPGIDVMSVKLWELSQRMGQNPNLPRMANPAAPVPPSMSTPAPGGRAITNPEQEYSEFTRQALLDVMLDQAFALSIREGQSLTLSVGVMVSGPTNPLAPIPRRLYLRLKGDDLIALRQNSITRDEAKKRIREYRY